MIKPGMIIIPDGDGNEIRVFDKTLSLKLKSERRSRRIGVINSKRQLYIQRKRDRHLHYKSKSYGFNFSIINAAKKFDSVLLSDEKGRYLIPNKIILEEGKFLYFKQLGFEKQIFLSLEIINNYKLK